MFPRVTKVRKGGTTYRYLQIVESFREEGVSKKRVVANLGRMEFLHGKLDELVRRLRRYCEEPLVAPEEMAGGTSGFWGGVLVARHLWEKTGLTEIIRRLSRRMRCKFDVEESAFVLVANRLTEPRSEHGLARWLEHTFVCDSEGARWKPDWLPPEKVTKERRVKVAHGQLNRWYRTLDALLAAKEEIERELYFTVRDLFNVKVDMVFYDVTSSFFRRRTPKGKLRRHGKSRDGHPREVQVVVGVVMANGWPIAHHVFPGNTADKATLQGVVADVEERFGIERVIVVADRGMVSAENLEFVAGRKYRYLVAIKGRRCEEAARVLDGLGDEWEKVDGENKVQEVALSGEGSRYLVVESEQRKEYERSLREKSVARTRDALGRIARSVKKGRLKDPAKIGARAGRALSENHGHRYFSYGVPSAGRFEFREDPAKMRAELIREGRYILKTDDPKITALDAVAAYKELSTVEDGFRDLKDVLEMRPVWHKTDPRVRAHIFVATLALFLKRTLQHILDEKGVNLSATDALEAMKSMSAAELDLGGRTERVVFAPGPDARRVLAALGIRKIDPPSPQRGSS